MVDSFAKSGTNEEEEKTQKINLKVKWVNGSNGDEEEDEKEKEVEEVYFSIDNDMPLRWLMIVYCDKIGVDYSNTRFEFKGARLREIDTPLQLSMRPFDLIQAYHFICVIGRSAVNYATVCIRMYKEKDTFLRVRRAAPLLPQLIRGLSDVGLKEDDPVSFVCQGLRLNEKQTADVLDIEDGDIIDAFKFDKGCSSLSIINPSVTLRVINDETGKDWWFKLRRRSMRLTPLMNKYCEIEGLKLDNVAFFHKDRKLTGSKTAEEEQLNDDDVIDARINR